MKRTQWITWLLPAILCLLLPPAVLNGQVYEHSITDTLLLGNVHYERDDQPAEHIDIELWAASGTPVATTVSSWGGEFYFGRLDPGEYVVSVDKPGYRPIWEKVQVPLATKRVMLQLKRISGAEDSAVSMRDLSIPPKARIALRDGIDLLKSDLPRAMADLQHAITLYPDYYEAYHAVGMANLMMERLPDAEEAFRRSIELSEHRYTRPLMVLGAVLCDEERYAEAEVTIREGLELDDTPWIGHLLMARALFGLGRWDEAERHAHEAILREPGITDAHLLLAHIHMRQNNAPAVVEDLDAFLKLEPDGAISEQARKVREDLWRYDRPESNQKVDREATLSAH